MMTIGSLRAMMNDPGLASVPDDAPVFMFCDQCPECVEQMEHPQPGPQMRFRHDHAHREVLPHAE